MEIALEFVPYFQVLRYSIDYFTANWLGSITPIFSYLDLSFLLSYASTSVQQIAFVLALVFMNLYWIIPFTLFLSKKEYSNVAMNVQKFVFIVAKNVLFLPLLNIVIRYLFVYVVFSVQSLTLFTLTTPIPPS